MKRVVVLTLALAAILAACGGGSKSLGKPSVVSHASASSSSSTSASTTSTTAPSTVKVGDTVKTSLGNQVAVFSYVQPVPPAQYETPTPGQEYAAVDYQACVSSTFDLTHDENGNAVPPAQQYVDVNPYDVVLTMPDNTRRQPTISRKDPALNDTQLHNGECVRGWITYQVPVGQRAAFVVDTKTTPPTKWKV